MEYKFTHIKYTILLILCLLVAGNKAWADTWDGTTKYTSIKAASILGSGTEADPYIIDNANKFVAFGYVVTTAYWKLTEDIDLGGYEWPYSGNTAKTFKGHFDGDGHTVSNYTITAVSNKANALIGMISGTAKANRAEVKNLNISNVTISVTADIAATTYIGALAGNVSQYADIVNVNVSDVAISVANLTGANYHGGLAGRLQKNSTVNHCSVTGVSITLGGNITGPCYVGGAVGSLESAAGDDSSITGCSASGTIKTDDSHTLNYNLTNAFGGVVGYVAQSATLFSEVKQCTSDVDFNLGGLTPATVNGSNYNMYRSGFVVGGVIGRINTPSRLPEHLFYSGKIYAPFAAVGPIVGVFNTNLNAAAYVYDDYSGLNATALSATEWKKADTWYFSDYKLGLSSDVTTQTTKTRNYNGTPAVEDGVNYLAVGEGTFKVENAISGASKLSATVLAYTADNNTGKTGISPQWNKNESTYPAYYMYFMQGVNRGLYKPTVTKEMMRLFASKGAYPKVEVDGDDTSGYEFSVDLGELAADANYTVTCQWYNSDKSSTIGTGRTLSMTKAALDAAGGVVNCEITVSGADFASASITLQGTDKIVVYVDGTNGKDNVIGSRSRGWTPETAVKTIDHANSLLDGGPWDKNYIVVIGDLKNSSDLFQSRGRNPATITGKWGGTDYEGVIRFKKGTESSTNPGDGPGKTGYHNYVSADTKFEYLTLYCTNTGSAVGNIDNCFFECHGHDVWFGKGIQMYGFRRLSAAHGNLEDRFVTPEFSVILTATNLAPANVEDYWTRTKPQTLTIESGHYGRILGGRFTSGYFSSSPTHVIQATAKHPSWAVINIDIDPENEMTGTEYVLGHSGPDNPVTYSNDITCVVAGLTDGTIYGDYIINLHGGTIGYVIGANQGNAVKNGSKTFTPLGGKSGDFGHWPNASYFGRTIINVDERDGLKPLTLENLYAGGLGRDAGSENTKSVVDLYVYGHTEINMKKGIVTGNIYGGGAGGVIGMNPWDPRVPYATTDANNPTNAIYQGVQYGTWGSKQAGSPLADVILHKIDADGNYTSETETLNLANSSTTINMSGGTVGGNVYGGGDGYVSVMVPNITMQGVGSVFGTSTLNISGGTITGSVYGGSQGNEKYFNGKNAYGQTITHIAEMNGTVNINITGAATHIGGNIYGAGQGIASTATQEYIDIATAGNTDLGEQYKTDINILIDLPDSNPFTGNIYGGGQMGAVDGNTKVIIKSGIINGDVFGGGMGENGHPNKAKVTGNTTVIVDSDWTEPSPEP